MYKPRNLTKAQFDLVLAALRNSHEYQVFAEVQRLSNEREITRLPPLQAGVGQINGGNGGRNLTVSFIDPARTMSGIEGIQAAQFKIRIVYHVKVEALSDGVDCYAFTGPIDSCVRAGSIVTVTARGLSSLLQRRAWEPFTIPKGVKKTDAIIRIAAAGGELRHVIDIPDRPATLGADFTVGAKHTYWGRMKDIAESLDLILAYNGPGELKGRPEQKAHSFVFRTGSNGYLTDEPHLTANFPPFHNEVHFYYGDKGHQMATAKAPPEHPLSAYTLRWNGVPRRKVLEQTRKTVKRKVTADRIAQNILDRELLHTVNVTAECFPFPFIEEGDLYRFNTTDYTGDTTISEWSLPLSPGEPMTLGWSDVRHGRQAP